MTANRQGGGKVDTNVIYCGDCLLKLKDIPDDSIDLIYIDPPFSSNRNYVAFWEEQEKRHFEDRFDNISAYLDYMKPRVKELYRVLKPTGTFYYHCDWHASHYIKMLLDSDNLFGYPNFRNEIIWRYRRWPSKQKNFQRMHDIIFRYSKNDDVVWNQLYEPLSEETQKRIKGGKRIVTFLDEHGKKRIRPTDDTSKGVPMSDVWEIRQIVGPTAERLGYPTQKPESLLERVIKASSNEGDVVLDAFCGCGTTLVVAQKLKREWIGIDISPTACRVMGARLEALGLKQNKNFVIKDMPKTVEELRQYPAFEFQNWVINALGGVPNKIKVRDMGIDGKLYPIEDIKKEKKVDKHLGERDLFGEIDRYIPIQVKRTDQVGRPDIENFEVAMKRDKRDRGIVIGFDFSRDALKEIRRTEREDGLLIEPKTVNQIVEDQLDKSLL
jgi:DNA modification methylase